MANYNEPTAGDLTEQDINPDTNNPNQGDTEVNPGQLGYNTEVDLDKTKIENYPHQPGQQQE